MDEGTGDGRVLAGRYRLLSELGRGGMGIVWRAEDELLGREVAVKEVRAPRELSDAERRLLGARLEREGRAAARIAHRNVVTVFDVVTEDGRPWIVMELVRGLSLADTLDAEGPLPPERAAGIGGAVLAALRVAHTAGVLHRDVKPGNVLLANDGRVVLTDFGIARVEGSASLTMTGELIGSPEFLAPERALGRTPGPESDLWSLGVTLYAAVEGHSPFRRDTPLSTMRAVVDTGLPPPRRAGALAPVLAGLLRKDPRERITAADAQAMLEAAAHGGPPTKPPCPVPAPPPAPAPGTAYGTAPTNGTGPARGAFGPPEPSPDTAAPACGPGAGRNRGRRSAAALTAGAVLAALVAGGAAWAALDRDGAAGRGGGASVSPGATDGRDGAGESDGEGGGAGPGGDGGRASTGAERDRDSGGDEETTGDKDGGRGGGKSAEPPLTITIIVTAVRGSYSGTCPPPADRAPAFSAVIKVDRVPAEVTYRWYTGSDRTSDPSWRTARFTEGGPRQLTVHHTELSYGEDGTYRDWVGLRVRSPRPMTSGRAAFSVTCEGEAPSGGASPTPSPAKTYAEGYAAERNTGR